MTGNNVKKTAKKVAKKKTENEVEVVRGTMETARTLSQLLDEKKEKKSTQDFVSASEYENYLKKQSLAEINKHALETFQLIPKDDKKNVIAACLREFKKIRSIDNTKSKKARISNKRRKEILELMADGR